MILNQLQRQIIIRLNDTTSAKHIELYIAWLKLKREVSSAISSWLPY